MKSLIEKIKQKKELKSLSDDFVQSVLEKYLEKNVLDLPLGKKDEKKVLKEVRAILHEVYGAFKSSSYHRRDRFLDDVDMLLKMHRSTKERYQFYPEIYYKLGTMIKGVKSVLDLGAGFNPLAYEYLPWKNVKYYATELTQDDVEFLQRFFDKNKIKGEAFVMDLLKVGELPHADVCFMFKLLDTLESLERDITESLLKKVNCKWLVASFPTVSLGGRKKISINRLVWFEKLIEGKKYETFELGGEYFYVIQMKR